MVLVVKNLPANAGDEDAGLTPGSGRAPGEGNVNPLQYSCLENPQHRGAPVGYSPWHHKEMDISKASERSTHTKRHK